MDSKVIEIIAELLERLNDESPDVGMKPQHNYFIEQAKRMIPEPLSFNSERDRYKKELDELMATLARVTRESDELIEIIKSYVMHEYDDDLTIEESYENFTEMVKKLEVAISRIEEGK